MTERTFASFSLKPFILAALDKIGFEAPTEIQMKMIPAAISGKNAIGQSHTGTGKTHAYLLPVLNKIEPERKEVQACILAPTRELARQIYEEILKITPFAGEKITTRIFIGGTDKQKDIEKLKTQPHIVVGTPRRVNDLAKEQALFVHKCRTLVVDEADLMIEMGFLEDLDQTAARMPKDLQMLVFSATIPEKIKPFLKKYMENPEHIVVQSKQATPGKIDHALIPSRHRDKKELVASLLKALNPYLAIVFANTKKTADEIADYLLENGVKAGRIHGDLTPRERKKMMKQIKDLEFQYIVATDLAARGIDIEGVSHVVNFELPQDLDFYIHRAGRTARAGFSGNALTIYDPSDEDAINKLEKRGISFRHVDLKDGSIVEIPPRNKRKTRVKQEDEADKIAKAIVKKPKKVKPGYKKKMQAEMENIRRRAKRKYR